MSKIKIIPSSGIFPKRNAYDLPGTLDGDAIRSAAATANNCDFRSGRVEPIKNLGSSAGVGGDSIYLFNGSWLSWAGKDVDVVKSPIESSDRIIYSGDDEPKIREGSNIYTLGLPAPTAAPSQATQAKTAADFTLTWHWYYEEPTGVRVDADASAISPTETTPGVTYTLSSIPAKIAASADSRFIMWAELYDGATYLGKIIPTPAKDSPQTDAEQDGVVLTGSLAVGATAVLTILYDTSRAAQYTKERSYYYSFVRIWSDGKIDLGPPSAASATLSVEPTEDVQLSSIETAPTGYNITHIWVYRLAVSDSGEDYQFVAQITAGTTTYLDQLADSALGEVDPIYTYSAPPTDLTSLRSHPAGFLIGISPTLKSVCCSVKREIHAFPALTHRIALKETPVSIDVVGQTIIVTTLGDPYYIYGEDPAALSEPDRVPINQANLSKKGTINTGAEVIYPSPDGLVSIGPSGINIVTQEHYTKEQWEALSPSTMVGAYFDRRVFMFMPAAQKHLLFNGTELGVIDGGAEAVHVDPESDTLYISFGNVIYPWGTGINREITWRSGYIRYPSLQTWGAARVYSQGYPVTLNLYRNGEAMITKTISSSDAVVLPKETSSREWHGFEVVTTHAVDSIEISESRSEL